MLNYPKNVGERDGKKKKKDSHTVITSSMRKIINGHWDDLP